MLASNTRRPMKYEEKVDRLIDLSVKTRFDAFVDVDWEHPDNVINHDDLRFVASIKDTLAPTSWFQSLPPEIQSRLGLEITVQRLMTGTQFENVLQQGFLRFINQLLPSSREFFYLHQEVIEESQHSMMFCKFINMSGLTPAPLPWIVRKGMPLIVSAASWFPELFFFYVLGGEEPIDYVQRNTIKNPKENHPLLQRIMQIHVIEEARHICFAHQFLEKRVAELSWAKRERLRWHLPIMFRLMMNMMLVPNKDILKRFNIPKEVLNEAFYHNSAYQDLLVKSISNTRRLCGEWGLISETSHELWKKLRLVE